MYWAIYQSFYKIRCPRNHNSALFICTIEASIRKAFDWLILWFGRPLPTPFVWVSPGLRHQCIIKICRNLSTYRLSCEPFWGSCYPEVTECTFLPTLSWSAKLPSRRSLGWCNSSRWTTAYCSSRPLLLFLDPILTRSCICTGARSIPAVAFSASASRF